MIDSIMAIPLLLMAFVLVFFLYKKLRIDLFRDRVFKIRRSLFLIAAQDPDAFFKDNTYYRFFEAILNAALSYTENFSFAGIVLDTVLRRRYIKNQDAAYFDYFTMKENYLAKVKSSEIKDEVSKLMDSFLIHYGMFLYTRTLWETLVFLVFAGCNVVYFAIKTMRERQPISPWEKEVLKESIRQPTARMMNTTQFAYAAARIDT